MNSSFRHFGYKSRRVHNFVILGDELSFVSILAPHHPELRRRNGAVAVAEGREAIAVLTPRTLTRVRRRGARQRRRRGRHAGEEEEEAGRRCPAVS